MSIGKAAEVLKDICEITVDSSDSVWEWVYQAAFYVLSNPTGASVLLTSHQENKLINFFLDRQQSEDSRGSRIYALAQTTEWRSEISVPIFVSMPYR